MKLKNKVAIITGSSQSIGRTIALRFAKEGAKVVINYLSHADLAHEAVKIIQDAGGDSFAYQADVSDEEQVAGMVRQTAETYGTIDILVNNAAIDPRKAWNEITVEEWDRVMAVNVRSQFICAKAVFPYMKKQGYGKIINVSSVTFHLGMKGYVHYVASKGAIIGFTRALAREVGGDHINVNCVTPGAVLTETELEKVGSQEAQEKATAMLKNVQSIPERMQASHIEGVFVFLASADSDFITGQTLNADGGWIMP
jgi:3-oxoacyl-[acyl-carrier protein] reductase